MSDTRLTDAEVAEIAARLAGPRSSLDEWVERRDVARMLADRRALTAEVEGWSHRATNAEGAAWEWRLRLNERSAELDKACADLASATATIAEQETEQGRLRNIIENGTWANGEQCARQQAEIEHLRLTITEQTHRADAGEGEAAVWRERCETAERSLNTLIDSKAPKTKSRQFVRMNPMEDLLTAAEADLASELAARIAAEGREAGLRSVIEGLLLSFSGFSQSLGYDWEETRKLPAIDDAIAALATPANGAAEVTDG